MRSTPLRTADGRVGSAGARPARGMPILFAGGLLLSLAGVTAEETGSPQSGGSFWDRFSSLVRSGQIEESRALCSKAVARAKALGMKSQVDREICAALGRLAQDAGHVGRVLRRAEAKLAGLTGKTVDLNGKKVAVVAVSEGVVSGEAEGGKVRVAIATLEPRQILKYGLNPAEHPDWNSYFGALVHVFCGERLHALEALKRADKAGLAADFYLQRISPPTDDAETEKLAQQVVSQAEWELDNTRYDQAEWKLLTLELAFAHTKAGSENVGRLNRRLSATGVRVAAPSSSVKVPEGPFLSILGARRRVVSLPTYYLNKYEVSVSEYEQFEKWIQAETAKGEAGDPHRHCYPGFLPDGSELSVEQVRSLQKLTRGERVAETKRLGLRKAEPRGKDHVHRAYLGPQAAREGAPRQENPDHPVTGVDWYDAWAYCQWTGGRLPSWQEWEKAASWDPKERRKRAYPWGDQPEAKRGNCAGDADGYEGLCPVSALRDGASAYGCLNMAGNVAEMVATWWGGPGVNVILCGGSFRSPADQCQTTRYRTAIPANSTRDCGFRVCRDTPPEE